MQREYFNGDRRRSVEQLDDVLAILPALNTDSSDRDLNQQERVSEARRFGKIAPAAALKPPKRARSNHEREEASDDPRQAFERAGWIFVQPTAAVRRSIEVGETVAGAAAVGKVYRQADGRTVIGTQKLSVRLQDDLSTADALEVLRSVGVEVDRKLTFAIHLYEVRVPGPLDPIEAANELHIQPTVIFAEPLFIEHVPQRANPTDTDYNRQWHLHNTGQDGGTVGADIDAEAAWDVTRGAGIRLTVVDNGFDLDHPDLASAIVAGGGYFKDDGSGGADFVQGLSGFPDEPHGTFCAGMALARANNTQGGCGVAYEADFLPVACLGDQVGTQVTLARAIAYAADPTREVPAANPADGADVICCSLGPNDAAWDMTATLQTAIDFAVTSGRSGLGTPVFWAVTNGNFQIQFDEVCSYANTIHVGRSRNSDTEDNCGFGPELDFLATGVDVYNATSGDGYRTWSGSSFAAPTAAGVGALLLSANASLTWQQVRQIMRDTAEKIGGVTYDGAGHNDDYGWGRVNAADALCAAVSTVSLNTATVTFNDVPEDETTARAVTFTVQRCGSSTFQITSGPSVTSGPGSFGVLPSTSAALPDVAAPLARQARLWLSFKGQNDGDVTTGTVTVRLVETGQEWTIPITANTIARPTVAVAMVLDQSGSMSSPSGVAALPLRNDVLKFAAPVFVNVLPEDDGIGIVAFDTDAYDRMPVATTGLPSAFDPARSTALSVIASHTPNPAGLTAIGDGVERAAALLAPAAGFDHKATVVFTDGDETASKYIADVSSSIGERVFAIGLGTADQLKPAALSALTDGTGGYLLMTGTLGNDDLFRLSKYYLQILAGVTNRDIVLDPDGYLLPGQIQRIPFQINEADIVMDAILLSDWPPHAFVFALETPAGEIISPASVGALGGQFVVGNGVSYFRMSLPVALGAGAHAGEWNAILAINPRYSHVGTTTHETTGASNGIPSNGLRYSLSVHSTSGIRLIASHSQTSNEPGATVTVRGLLTEYGIPIESNRAGITAELERPDGSHSVLVLGEVDPGVYEATFLAAQAGVYQLRLLANGKSMRGRPFTREHLLTAGVWKGGDQPPPSTPDDSGGSSVDWCDFFECLFAAGVIGDKAIEHLRQYGVDIDALRRCLARMCRKADTPPPVVRSAADTSASAYRSNVTSRHDDDLVAELIDRLGVSGNEALRTLINESSEHIKDSSSDCGCGSKGNQK